MTVATWFNAGDVVTYFDGTVNRRDDTGVILATRPGGVLVRWDNGLADACECDTHRQGEVKKDCAGEWFNDQDVRPVVIPAQHDGHPPTWPGYIDNR